jgi:TPR repeat protein
MGLIYESGRGVGRDFEQAARWYLLAAEAGHPGAQFNLGHLYRLGTGVEPDMIQAVRWWRAAAEQGLSQAQLALGVAYQRGEGTEADPEEAVFWFRRAAENGNPTADYALGLAYENGVGVERDIDTAKAHYEKAAAAGIEPALTRLGALSFPATEEEPPPPPSEAEVAARLDNGMDEVAEAPPPETTASGEPRYIQIAAYVDEQRAERAWNDLVGQHDDLLGGLPHRVLAVDLGGETGRVYRLQAGPMPDAGEAQAICTLLKSRNTDCFLVEP